MDSKSPSFCRLCNVALASPSVWRQHAKSDWHVYNLRMRVAEPGAVVSPPPSSPKSQKITDGKSESPLPAKSDDDDSEEDDEDAELSDVPDFNSEQCLFCGDESDSFEDNLAHMSKAHSFAVPHQDHLTVQVETVIEYLYLIIYGYGECTLCSARRNTVQGIQHHMMAKSHCRIEVSSAIAEFYKMPEPEYHADEESLRLPSGKLLNHRTRATGPVASKTARQPAPRRLEQQQQQQSAPSTTRTASSALVSTRGDGDATPAPSTQLARLSRGDQQSLAHLPDHEVRSLLAITARHLDQSQREEKQAKLKLEKASNITLTAQFRADTSKRFRGVWG